MLFRSPTNVGTDPLPVKLVSFSATANCPRNSNYDGCTTDLAWQTATEQNTKYFTIERSTDGNDFVEASGMLPIIAAGNSTAPRYYHTTDEQPAVGVNYYRLRTTDADGTSSVSRIRLVTYGASNTLAMYPNPAANKVTLQMNAENVYIKIYDALGRVVSTYAGISLVQPYTISLTDLIDGIYYVEVRDGESITTQKLVKQ